MLQIRSNVWHGAPGWRVSGRVRREDHCVVSIWTRYRDLAERIRESLKAGTFDDCERAIWDEELRRNLKRYDSERVRSQ
jgi:hypothetical protein